MDQRLEGFFKHFLASENVELEARFGTRKKISRINFDNVIRKLKSLGFSSHLPSGSYHLNINNEFVNLKTSETQMSNIRTQISHLVHIKEYCKKNIIPADDIPPHINFYSKRSIYTKGERLRPLDYNDFQFRVNLKEERKMTVETPAVTSILKNWKDSKKIFRFIKRFTFTHPNYPLKIDCSVVKSSKKGARGMLIPEYNVEAAKIFNRTENYEIEIEMVKDEEKKEKLTDLIKKFKTAIKYVMSGLQETNFPISYPEQENVLQAYMNILYPSKKDHYKKVTTRDFCGPSSKSLQFINIRKLSDNIRAPNIRKPYTVTEKADGIRKLLFISGKELGGKIYLIDMNMNIQFTGTICKKKDYYRTIMDGEHILNNKNGEFADLYLIFDIYYFNGDDIRMFPFIKMSGDKGNDYRLTQIDAIIKDIELNSVTKQNKFNIKKKMFYSANGSQIFKHCKTILDRERNGLFQYEIDGLVFTPAKNSVGLDGTGKPGRPSKRTWDWSLKWKPAHFNTIDFLVTVKKHSNGQDFIGNIFEDGENLSMGEQLSQYKTLILRVGFDESRHGFLNPCDDLLNKNYSKKTGHNLQSYRPQKFMPTEPTDNTAYLCNILLENGERGSKYLFTENKKETFDNNTIVEFRYDKNRKQGWRWIPIRVRYDKTAAFRRGENNFGNAYHVAQSIWKSIHNPITNEIISTGKDIPEEMGDDDVYYKKTGKTSTRSLRDFHNQYIKRKLILGAASKGATLIDLACGKGGDFPKWIYGGLAFVFGVDIARDNIENRLDGICARFLKYRKRYANMPKCLFVNGDSKLNVRSGDACATDQGKKITQAVFGEGSKDEKKLGKAVFENYGVGKDGFDVVSVQFALHYFFQDINTLNGFLQNVSETCKVGGYFIGTCYNGEEIYKLLEDKKPNEGVVIIQDDKKMWEIVKRYDSEIFKNDETSLGYKIDVFQESINKSFSEYLVNFTYLHRLLENYGFRKLTKEEAEKLDFPNSVGSFEELYHKMESQKSTGQLRQFDYGQAFNMNANEKKISFLNNYFIYKKVSNVNSSQVSLVITESTEEQEDDQTEEGDELSELTK